MNEFIFREYDIRGIVKTDLTPDVVEKIGKAFGTMLKRNGGTSASVGGDIRLTTSELKEILIHSIISTGIDIIDLGTCPTGAQYFSHFSRNVDGGVMITGSHNPPEYNGFKMTMFRESIFGKNIQMLKKHILEEDYDTGKGKVTTSLILPDYIKDLRAKLKLKRRLRVVFDYGNGAASLCGTEIFNKIENLEAFHLFEKPDGTFPNHHPDPTVERNLTELKKVVQKKKADLGIGFDGDADRIGVVDENGTIVFGDKLLIIYARDALIKRKQDIIFDVKCSEALIEEIKKGGGNPVMSATGHSLLKGKMKETGALIAGEMSGHMFFGDENYGYDDAIYAAIRLLNILSQTNTSLEEHLRGITPYVATPEIRLETKNDEEKFRIAKEAVQYFTRHYECITVDGVRVQFGDGWGLVRPSNTQPVLVLRVEAKTQYRLDEIKKIIINKLSEFGNIKEEIH